MPQVISSQSWMRAVASGAVVACLTCGAVLAQSAAPQQPTATAGASPDEIARVLLDDTRDQKAREELAREAAARAVPVVRALVAGLPDDEEEEYRRIPWIWRVSVAAGRSGEVDLVRPLFDLSLPQPGAGLRDWEAVVLGGGVIMGMSQAGLWPGEVITQWVRADPALRARWDRALQLSSAMTDNDKVRDGTRYDALRVLGVASWEQAGAQLVRYLGSSNAELQLGAVGGLSDMQDPRAGQALLDHLGRLVEANRRSAINALLRTEERKALLRSGLQRGDVRAEWLSDEQRKRLDAKS